MNGSPLHELLDSLTEGISHPPVAWSLTAIAAALALAWLVARWVRGWTQGRLDALGTAGLPGDALRFSIAGFRRLAFPVVAALTVLGSAAALRALHVFKRSADERMLRLALTLLVAMAVVRLLVYVLRRALPQVRWLAPFERVLALAIWAVVALYLTGWAHEVHGWLAEVVLPLGGTRVSLWDVAVATMTVLLTLLVALWAGSALETRLMHAETLDLNLRVVLSRLFRALLVLVGVLAALSLVGIDLTVLSVFGGALGVGLGLGLQRIASSYVSGFIILLDRSITIGDMITVDKHTGKVTEIKTRYTVLRGLDGTEAIVPNEKLVAEPVSNLSYTDPKVMLRTEVSVAYSSDVERALGVLVESGRAVPRVLAEPAPSALLTNFAADGVMLSLSVWIDDPENGRLNVLSDVNREILRRLRTEGIEIPFPQRDIRIVGGGLPESPARN
ncbi:MAG: mechanosensitive ion channel family protein [Betaproteobacteria bacterium]